jgi:hypothetical protein
MSQQEQTLERPAHRAWLRFNPAVAELSLGADSTGLVTSHGPVSRGEAGDEARDQEIVPPEVFPAEDDHDPPFGQGAMHLQLALPVDLEVKLLHTRPASRLTADR